MGEVKRVLWVEDLINNAASRLFAENETKIVGTMDDAISEFSGDNLYVYDTIVLDIDFENGINNPDEVVRKLCEKIYLSKDQSEKQFIIDNGGYLLFLYLLERGYPSDQVAFLTGNTAIISQLKAFNEKCLAAMSKGEIADAIIRTWDSARAEDENESLNIFEASVDKMPIDVKYKTPPFFDECIDKLFEDDYDGVRQLVDDLSVNSPIETVENTGDKIIFRFHDANLEAPCYFSKNANDISGHNLADAEKWLNKQRTAGRLLRWLLLKAGDFLEESFRSDPLKMNRRINEILKETLEDGGIRSAFRQMYFVFDGLRTKYHKGIYFQAISAMLIPFEAEVKLPGNYVNAEFHDIQIRRMCTCCLKKMRNYCAHNYMGSTLSNQSTLFFLIISMTALLDHEQRILMGNWYQEAANVICEGLIENSFLPSVLNEKVMNLTNYLSETHKIELEFEYDANHLPSPYCIFKALGCNKEMDKAIEQNVAKREDYYVFTIAAYIVGWFNGEPLSAVEENCDEPVLILYKIALNIVDDYEYPLSD